jgi:TonB family protein
MLAPLLLAGCATSTSSMRPLLGVRMASDLESGWTTITAPDGSYSFAMPGRPEALAGTTTSTIEDLHVYRLRVESNSRAFDVIVRPTPAGATIEQALAWSEGQLLERWRAVPEKGETGRGRFGPMRTFSGIRTESTHQVLGRIEVAGGRILAMTTLHSAAGLATAVEEAERFFGSLQVKDPPLAVRIHHDYVAAVRGLTSAAKCKDGVRQSQPFEMIEPVIEAAAASFGGREARLAVDPRVEIAEVEPIKSRLTQRGYKVSIEPTNLPDLPCLGSFSTTESARRATLKKSEIGDVVRARLGAFKHCYVSILKHHPAARGTVGVEFAIGSDGAVGDARIGRSTLGVPEVDRCVLALVRTLRFPPPKGGPGPVVVVYPFKFTSTGSK